MSEPKKKTQQDLLNDEKFIATLVDYNLDRYGEVALSAEEALEQFIEDYRSLNSNTVEAFRFVNYAEDVKDGEYKKNLADAYRIVDTELENFYADKSTSFGQKVEAVGEYALYNILDPINVFGFGVGKLVSGTLGRQAIKGAVGKALGTKLKTGIAVGAGEGVASAGVDYGAQQSEIELGLKEDVDMARLGIAGASGAVLGGGLGALAARGTDAARVKMDDIIPENPQDKLANVNLGDDAAKDARFKRPPKDYTNFYVTAKSKVDDKTLEADVGRVVGREGDNLNVSYNKLDADGVIVGSDVQSIPLKQLRAVSDEVKKKYTDKTLTKGFFNIDPEDVAKGDEIIDNIFSPEEAELFRSSLNLDTIKGIREAIEDAAKTDTTKVLQMINPGDRISEIAGNILKVAEDFPDSPVIQNLTASLATKGISTEQFGLILKADSSGWGRKGQELGKMRKFTDAILSGQDLGKFDLQLTEAAKKLTPDQKASLTYLQNLDKQDSEFGNTLGRLVDLWRGLLVTSPATTLRNIIGSFLRVPSETSTRLLDRSFQSWEQGLMGRQVPVDAPDYKILDLAKNFGDVEHSIAMTKYIGQNFSQVEKQIFKTIEDFDTAFDAQSKKGIISSAGKVVKFLNGLNIAQDRSIKSAAFLAAIDREVVRAVRSGEINIKGINGIEDLIRQNRLDLLNNKMIEDSIADSYRLTYQTRDAGKEVSIPLLSQGLTSFQKIVNSSPALKVIIPFPNFQANSIAYLANRVPGLSLLKPIRAGIGIVKKGGKKRATERRGRLADLEVQISEKIEGLKDLKGAEGARARAELKRLGDERTKLQASFGETIEDLRKLKQGIAETIDGMVLLTVAYQMRDSEAGGDGTKWYELKDREGNLYDLRPIFPLTPFLYMAEVLRRQLQGKTEADFIPESLSNDAMEAIIGTSVRAGPIGKLFREGRKIFESESPFDGAKRGELIGELAGYLAAGILTPLRPVSDIAKTFGDRESRLYLDPKLRRNIDPSKPWYTNAWRAMMSDLTRGVEPIEELLGGDPYESKAFGKVPAYASPTTSEDPSTRTIPAIKQITGTAQRGARDPVEQELLNVDIDPFKARIYSGVPEYDNVANRLTGEITQQVLLPYIRSNEYQNMPFEQKRQVISDFLNKESEADSGIDFFRGKYADVKEAVSAAMKESYPTLTSLKNLRKQGSSKINKALEEIQRETPGSIDLSYVDEKNPDNEAEVKRLQDIIARINAKIKGRRSQGTRATFSKDIESAKKAAQNKISQGSLTPVRKNKGGYVSQMNNLGF